MKNIEEKMNQYIESIKKLEACIDALNRTCKKITNNG